MRINFISIYDIINPVQITAHKLWKQHKSKKYPKGMVKTKPPHPPEVNGSNNLTDEHKGLESKPKRYTGKKIQTKTQGQ